MLVPKLRNLQTLTPVWITDSIMINACTKTDEPTNLNINMNN